MSKRIKPTITLARVDDGSRAPQMPTHLAGSRGIGELTVAVVLVTMPLTFVATDNFGGLQLSGWAWLASLAIAVMAVATGPLERRALGHLAPYLLFLALGLASLLYTPDFSEGLLTLGQMSAPALVYLVAFSAPLSSSLLRRSLHLLAFVYVAVAAALLVFGFPQEGTGSIGYVGLVEGTSVALRPLSVSLVILFILVSALSRSRAVVAAAGVAGLVFTIGTGSRMATVALLLAMWVSPRVFNSWVGRGVALLVVGALLPLALSIPAFQERFFFGESAGTVEDLVTLAPNVNTSGRRELWPELIGTCEDKAFIGYGIGASYELSRRASQGVIEHPHNDYIRTFCDSGLVGSVAAWWFVAAAGFRNLRRLRGGRRNWVVSSALAAVLACVLLALAENVLVYPAQFMLPMFVLLAWADASDDVQTGALESVVRPERGGSPD